MSKTRRTQAVKRAYFFWSSVAHSTLSKRPLLRSFLFVGEYADVQAEQNTGTLCPRQGSRGRERFQGRERASADGKSNANGATSHEDLGLVR